MDNPDIGSVYSLRGLPSNLTIGRAKALDIHPDRVLDFWVFAVMTSGLAPMQVGSDRATLQPGQYFLLPPHIRHFGTERHLFDTIWFHFDMEHELKSKGTSLAEDDNTIELPVFGAMPAEISYLSWGTFVRGQMDGGYCTRERGAMQLMAMLELASMSYRRRLFAGTPEMALAQRVMDLLEQRYSEDLTSAAIAGLLEYSYGHLERIFRRAYGATIQQKLAQIRIREAISYLSMGQSIKATALAVGYEDYYYFLRVFKKVTGKSPGQMR